MGRITLERVAKRFAEVEVIPPLDLEIEDGEMVSIVGPSGSGKSTLLHAIGGLDRDYEGTIEVDGRDLHAMNDVELSAYRNRHVGFVFQTFNLLQHQTCAENVALPSLFARGKQVMSHGQALERAREVLARVDLSDKVDAAPTTLSGGQRQRVAIARALFNEPQMMLCDEPTGNLDSAMGAAIMDLFCRLNREDGITVVIVTHDPRIASATHRRVRVQDGRVLEDEGDDDLAATPRAEAAGEAKAEASADGGDERAEGTAEADDEERRAEG